MVVNMVAEEGQKDGWNITLFNQPPNSPDMNVLDLGYFNAIQALQSKESLTKIDDLIEAVETSFKDLDPNTLNNSFLTLQAVMECCLDDGGGNSYTLPHKSKAKLARKGSLPQSFTCDMSVISDAQNYLEF